MRKEIDIKILDLYQELINKLDESDKKFIHFNSLSNFIYHLLEKPEINTTENGKLQKIGEIRIKEKIYNYLKKVSGKKFNRKESINLYNEYIDDIGGFMIQYYNFSNAGGKIKIVSVLLFLFIGLIIDLVVGFFIGKTVVLFSPSLFTIKCVYIYRKHKQKKLFGLFF